MAQAIVDVSTPDRFAELDVSADVFAGHLDRIEPFGPYLRLWFVESAPPDAGENHEPKVVARILVPADSVTSIVWLLMGVRAQRPPLH